MAASFTFAQEKMYVHTNDGMAIEYNVSDVDFIDFNKGASYIVAKAENFDYQYAEPEMVDLGLSVYWASFNLGATKPEEPGYYFGWGEVAPKGLYTWETYLKDFGAEMQSSSSGIYNTDDAGTSKDPLAEYDLNGSKNNIKGGIAKTSNDAAYVNLGSSWRMPTQDELIELYNKCTWEWTAINGMNGCKVTSTIDGYTDKYIFIPCGGTAINNSISEENVHGYIWSGEPNHYHSPNGFTLTVGNDVSVLRPVNYGCCNEIRFFGNNIRPVADK